MPTPARVRSGAQEEPPETVPVGYFTQSGKRTYTEEDLLGVEGIGKQGKLLHVSLWPIRVIRPIDDRSY
jgi:hypothetical protein